MKKHLFIILLIYGLQFILLPWILPQYYPTSNEALFILIVPLVIISILFRLKMKEWFFIDLLYLLCIWIYHGKGLYGLGMRGISLDGATSVYSNTLMMISLGVILIILLLIQGIVSKLKN